MTNLIDNLGGLIGFGENHLTRGSSHFVGGIDLRTIFGPSGLEFLGVPYTYLAVNHSGSISLSNDAGFGVRDSHPFQLGGKGHVVLAPFLSAVGTHLGDAPAAPDQVTPTPGGTSRGSDLVWYDLDASGDGAVTATWDDVAAWSYASTGDEGPTLLNAFQVQVIGRGRGDFDIVFRYETIGWGTSERYFPAAVGLYDEAMGWRALQPHLANPAILPGNTGVPGYSVLSVRSGTDRADRVEGTDGDDILGGGRGGDKVSGFGGNDMLAGNLGFDTLMGGGGNDLYVWDGRDLIVEPDGRGRDTMFSKGSAALVDNVEDLVLTGGADVDGTGNALDNVLAGNAGDNILDGGEGRDTADYGAGARWGVTVDLGLGGPQTVRTGEHDTFVSIENVVGTPGDDALIGDGRGNVLAGGKGRDTLDGADGNDTLIGGADGDIVRGGAGDDVFRFLPGDFGGTQRVMDFVSGSDRIDLTGFDVKPQLAGRQGLTFIGTEEFVYGRARGMLRLEDGMLYGSTDADWHAEFRIDLRGVISLSEFDFLL